MRTALEREVTERYHETFGSQPTAVETRSDVRYAGQSHELEIAADAGWDRLRVAFETAHHRRFGFDRPGERIELVNLRSVATGVAPMTWSDLPPVSTEGPARGRDGIWERASLPAGFALRGPAMVVEANSAVLLEAGDELVVLTDGTLEIGL
jgi:N-methylhydantoinase A/oxoprolinase/acetone carboxylase beta subunit